jgi:nitric oxide dioxygenase
MTPTEVGLIRASWAAVERIAHTAANLFYGRLFALDPAIERLFRRTDMHAQRRNLMQTLTVVVKSLDRLDQIVPAVQALGRRHAGYGVRSEHDATVGAALLWTLEQGLGEAFTPRRPRGMNRRVRHARVGDDRGGRLRGAGRRACRVTSPVPIARPAELDAKLGTDAGTRPKVAVAQLKALLEAS